MTQDMELARKRMVDGSGVQRTRSEGILSLRMSKILQETMRNG
jgi:hypothetical protein